MDAVSVRKVCIRKWTRSCYRANLSAGIAAQFHSLRLASRLREENILHENVIHQASGKRVQFVKGGASSKSHILLQIALTDCKAI